MLRVLDLFSGIGGFSLGLERTGGFKTVAFCEIEAFPRRVLAKHWPEVPIYDDVRTLTAERLAADGIAVDVICGGFPCQDISAASATRNSAGIDGSKSGLWREYARLIVELRPRWVVVENSPRLRILGADRVLAHLEASDYTAWPFVVGAVHAGAPHRRSQAWIVAHANSEGEPTRAVDDEMAELASACALAHAGRGRHGPQEGPILAGRLAAVGGDRWGDQPPVLRVDDGLPGQLDRRRRVEALGNAVVPQIPELIGRAILAVAA
jgi:DNA (cytosine-5)-methyltransferase 1